MIKYIGSKRTLVPLILGAVRAVPGVRTVVDLFSGTSRVGHALKAAGFRVLANDHNAYAHKLAQCYVQADRDELLDVAAAHIRDLNALPGKPGFFTETYCVQSRFFHPKNGARIDAIRDEIAARGLPEELEAVLLVSLMEAADRVDSTTGVQMAYLKQWAPRAHNDLELRVPNLLPQSQNGKSAATCAEAVDAAATLRGDLLYLDPPYNQHSYLGNYHVWESLVRWDRMPVYGIACKRLDCKERRSVFNSRPRIFEAMANVLRASAAETVVVSFNNEGYIEREQMEGLLASLWSGTAHVYTMQTDYKRYVGAQIGIYNPQGEKVGKVSHLRNLEYLYVAARRDLSRELAPLMAETPKQLGLFG